MTADSNQQPVRFLLVEDDPDHAELVRRAIEGNRILNELTHVPDAEGALAILNRESPHEACARPDVILLDVKLPRMTGLELLEVIKDTPALASIPVVMLTTSEAEIDRTRAYTRHVNSYLIKPLEFERFHKMVQDLQLYWAVWNRPPPEGA